MLSGSARNPFDAIILEQFVAEACDFEKCASNNFTTRADMRVAFGVFCLRRSVKPPNFCETYYTEIFARNSVKETKDHIFEGVTLKPAFRAECN
jgi:hypothetical protein